MAFLLKDYNLLAFAIILVCAVLLIAMTLFKRKIGNLLDRLWQRTETDVPPVSQQKTETNSFERTETNSLGINTNIMPDSKSAIALSTRIINDVEKLPVPSEEKIKLLSILAANAILRAEFEIKYRIIFRSQLEALAGLRQKGPHSLDPYYQSFLSRVEERREEVAAIGLRTEFEAWVGFLTALNVPYIEIDAGIARITERGDAFMEFTARSSSQNHVL